MMKGLPASGKTTAAKNLIVNNPGVYKRVNKDDLRAMLDNGRWSGSNEKFVLSLRDHIIKNALTDGKNVIVDDTNFHEKHETRLREIANQYNAILEIVMVEAQLEECIRRDLERPNSVGEKVIRGMYDQYLRPKEETIFFDEGLPSAYIFDIDGTLATMQGRGPYDWDKVNEDLLNDEVARVLRALKQCGYKVIIFTGRDGVCEVDTHVWLQSHGIPYDHFDIRPAGSTEKDAIIKKGMLESVRDRYNVLGVFDDRDQVVEMWRSLGLRCFQVGYGNF